MKKNNLSQQNERIACCCVCCGSLALKKFPAILMPFVAHRALGWEPVEITDEWGLKTIKNGMAYSICNSVLCTHCGLLFLDIRFNESEMNSLYDGYREKQYTELREKYEPGYKVRNDELNADMHYISDIEQFLSPYLDFPVSILNWGGDSGKNTPFRNKSKLFHIYDISNKSVIDGAKKIDKLTAINTQYDLIVCSNVLEHVPYPAEVVFDMKNSMKKGTILYIEVPHENIIRTADTETDLHKKKKHWHEHINFFTKKSLQKLLNGCGLTIIDMKQLEVSTGCNSACLYGGNAAYIFMIVCKLK